MSTVTEAAATVVANPSVSPTREKKVKAKPQAQPSTKRKRATKVTKVEKPAKPKNLRRQAAVNAVLTALLKGPATRTELKAKAPYANYTALMSQLIEDGLVTEEKEEGDRWRQVDLTAQGRKAAKAIK